MSAVDVSAYTTLSDARVKIPFGKINIMLVTVRPVGQNLRGFPVITMF